MQHRQTSATSRYVALVAALTALYSVYGYVSGIQFRFVTRSFDLFFLLPVFFAVLVSLTGRRWSATLLSTIVGVLFLSDSSVVPLAPHITISLIVNGLVFDLYLQESKTSPYDLSKRQLVTAAVLGNFAMAVSGLLVFQVFSGPQPASIWALALIGDPLVGGLGGFFGSIVIERVKGVQTRRVLEAKTSLKVRV